MVSKKKRSLPRLRLIFWPKSEIQTFFQPKKRWCPKKKRSSPEFRLRFKRFFKLNHDMYFTTSAPNFLWGSCFQFFTKNRPQKHQKHAILHTSQANGGARAPPPPLATLLLTTVWKKKTFYRSL